MSGPQLDVHHPPSWMYDADGELMKPELALYHDLRLTDAQWDFWFDCWDALANARQSGRNGVKLIGGTGDPEQPRWVAVVDALIERDRLPVGRLAALRSEWIKYTGCPGCGSSGAFIRRDKVTSGPRTYEKGQVRVSCGRRCRTRDVLTELGIETVPEPTVIEWDGADTKIDPSPSQTPTSPTSPRRRAMNDDDREPTDAPAPPLPLLPSDMWTARDVFRRIRQAAEARSCSADAVLAAVLTRTAAFVPCTTRVESGVGKPASLNLYTVIVGPSGGGKTTAASVAGDLIRPPNIPKLCIHPGRIYLTCEWCQHALGDEHDWYADSVPLGSGEGIAETYMGQLDKKTRAQLRGNAYLYCDEGEQLTRSLERNGATLGEALRRGWAGQTLGQANATAERIRRVNSGRYALGLTIGFQTATIGPLLDDGGKGTPQRFLYASAVDPTIPDEPPDVPDPIKAPWPTTDRDGNHTLTVADDITKQLRAEHLAKARGEYEPAPLDAHRPLTLVKVAGILAVLDDRSTITLDDWSLSEQIWATSCAVRDTLIEQVTTHRRDETRRRDEAYAQRQIHVNRRVAETDVKRVSHTARRKIIQSGADGIIFSQLRKSIAHRDRDHLEAALELLLDEEHIDIEHGEHNGKPTRRYWSARRSE